MTFLMGLVLIFAIFFWMTSLHYEWCIPPKWQAKIVAWKERFSKKSYLPKNHKLPNWIEIQIDPDWSIEQKERYIACLQRRFSEFI